MIYSICISLTLQNEVHGLFIYFLAEGWGDRGLVTGEQQNRQLAYKAKSITVYSRGWIGKAGLGLCGLNQTGRTLYTYQGSCDRIHSVFLVLFWLGMDLEKQKDGATDMHVWNCLEWSEDLFLFSFVRQTLLGLRVLGQKFIFHHHTSSLDCFLCEMWRQKTIITVGGHECTLRLILLLKFAVSQQDVESIRCLTIRWAPPNLSNPPPKTSCKETR